MDGAWFMVQGDGNLRVSIAPWMYPIIVSDDDYSDTD